jgi:hypothetical protein
MKVQFSGFRFGLAALAAILGASLIAMATASTPASLPGIPWRSGGELKGEAADGVAVRDGRSFRVTAIFADPEVTLISFLIEGRADDPVRRGAPGGPARLILDDGTIVPAIANTPEGAERGTGTIMFPGLPAGSITATLEIDRLYFGQVEVNQRFAVPVRIDNRDGYAGSRRSDSVLKLGSGEGAITIESIARTPSVIVVRGTFDGLTTSAIQALRGTDFFLTTSDGQRQQAETGRWGFGEDYRQFVIRFPAGPAGRATLELGGVGSAATFEIEVP